MRHLDEDILLKYSLDLCEESEAEEISIHLADCDVCRDRLKRVGSDVAALGAVEVDLVVGGRPRPATSSEGESRPMLAHREVHQPRLVERLVRIAAVFILGAAVGWGSASLSKDESVCVSPSYATIAPDLGDDGYYAVSDATGN